MATSPNHSLESLFQHLWFGSGLHIFSMKHFSSIFVKQLFHTFLLFASLSFLLPQSLLFLWFSLCIIHSPSLLDFSIQQANYSKTLQLSLFICSWLCNLGWAPWGDSSAGITYGKWGFRICQFISLWPLNFWIFSFSLPTSLLSIYLFLDN